MTSEPPSATSSILLPQCIICSLTLDGFIVNRNLLVIINRITSFVLPFTKSVACYSTLKKDNSFFFLFFISEPVKLWGIIDYKYLKVFSGDFTGEWYVVPSVLGPIVILLLVFIVCLIRRAATKKR